MVSRGVSDGRLGIIHVHSVFSHDGRDELAALHEFGRQRGLGFIGMTDHAEDFDAGRFAEFSAACAAASSPTVALLPGLEYRFAGFAGMHLLAFGLARWMAPETPAEFITMARQAARFTMAAHPALYDYGLPDEVARGIDAVEIWNASYNTRWLPDPDAIALLGRLRRVRPEIVGCAGLDQHDARNDRETRVLLTGAPGADPLLELKAGRFVNLGRTMRLDPREPLGPAGLGLLRAARWSFDRLERVQAAIVRARRMRRR